MSAPDFADRAAEPAPPARRPDVPLRRPRTRDRATPAAGITGPMRLLLGPATGGLRLGRARPDGAGQLLRVDWPQCRAHGLCAEIAPELVQLDEWGYPRVDRAPLTGDDLATARRAVQVCPTLALRLTDPPPQRP